MGRCLLSKKHKLEEITGKLRKLEQQPAFRRAERQISRLVEYDEVETEQAFEELPGLAHRLFQLERIDNAKNRTFLR